MLIRERIEELEDKYLSVYGSRSKNTRGRDFDEEKCDIRTEYQRDRDRILHSKAFRRLKDKTQVFLSPQGDHYRTRLMHTLEVAQISRTIAKALSINEDLVEAIALGHDLGHTPFGHAGERALDKICTNGFRHNEQSVRIVEKIEKDGRGLNLTYEVRDGIVNHKTSRMPCTLEGKVVRLADKFAYTHHDIDDGERAGIIKPEDIPSEIVSVLGATPRQILNTLVHDIIKESFGKDDILMSDGAYSALMDLREYMFRNLYTNPLAKDEEGKAIEMIEMLYKYYLDHPSDMSSDYVKMIERGEDKETAVCDYISGMTDQYAIEMFNKHHVPRVWKKY